MRITHRRTRYGQWPVAVGLGLFLALAWATAAAAGMESSAERQVLGIEAIKTGAAISTSTEPPQKTAGGGGGTARSQLSHESLKVLSPRSEWKYKRTKVKRRQQRLNSSSNLPGSTNASHHPLPPSLPQRQRYLKVNQVFESERRMSPAEVQRNHGKIVLLGLFELSTSRGPRPDGLSELGAATMAVEHINRKRLLPGYTLELVTNDTQVRGCHSWDSGVLAAPAVSSRRVGSIKKLNFNLVARAALKLNKKICSRVGVRRAEREAAVVLPRKEGQICRQQTDCWSFYCDGSLPPLMGQANVSNNTGTGRKFKSFSLP